MAFTMELTDGTTTIDILQTNDTTVGYHLQTESYTPQINRRNPSDFGAVYLPVLENFTIAIVGSTPNDVHVKLAALVNLMDNVRLWFDSDAAAADAVTFVFKPGSSTEAADYQALIVSDAEIGYSQYIEHVGNWYRMPDVRVSFMRNEWLGAEEIATSPTNLITNPSGEINTTGFTAVGSTVSREVTDQAYGVAMIQAISDNAAADEGVVFAPAIAADGIYTFSVTVWGSGTVYIRIEGDGGGAAISSDITLSATKTRYSITTTTTGSSTFLRCKILTKTQHTATIKTDGWQAETLSPATTYIDGDQPGCIWNGAAHASTSTRGNPTSTQPGVVHVGFNSAAALPSPVDIDLSSPFGGTATIGDRHAIISPVAITYIEAETMAGVGAGSITSVAIAGASAGAVASFSAATVTTDSISHIFPSGGAYFLYNNFAVWATIRNPSSSTPINWTIETTHDIGSATTTGQLQSKTTVIESGRIYPRIVYLGSFFMANNYAQTVSNSIELFVTNDAADATGNGDLEIDAITIHNIDTDADGYFSLSRLSPDGVWGSQGEVLSRPAGIVYNSDSALPNYAVAHAGSSRQYTIGSDVYALFLDVTDTATGWITPGSPAARTYTLTATRRLASLTPL